MKPIYFSPLLSLLLFAPFGANAADSGLRVTCEGEDVGAEVLVNGKFRGECPVDLQVPAGPLKLLVRKKVDAQRERVFEQDFRMGEGTAKKVEVRLGAEKLNAAEKARRESNQQRLGKMPFDALQKEAESGNVQAMSELMSRYAMGRGGASKDNKLANTWTRKAAETGDPASMYLMGLRYSIGDDDLPKSSEQALQWYRKAAAAGHVQSMLSIGSAYQRGKGVVEDHVAAAKWHRRAADAGSASGMENLGVAYALGRGVPQSEEQSVAWFRKAIEVDDEDDFGHVHRQSSMSYLATAYEKGRGVAKDEQQAISWWRKAAEGKYPDNFAVEELKKRGLR